MSIKNPFGDVVERVSNGEAEWEWVTRSIPAPSNSRLKGCSLRVKFMADAMKLSVNGTLHRFPVTAVEQQQIADMIGGIFHTEKTQDDRHRLADTTIGAVVQVPPGSGRITALSNPVEYSQWIDRELLKVSNGPYGLVSTIGKPWTLTNRMILPGQTYGSRTSYNYGWHDRGGIYKNPVADLNLWQPVIQHNSSRAHNDDHADSSQVCHLLSRDAIFVDAAGIESEVDLRDVYTGSELWPFTCYSEPLRVVRQPSVLEVRGFLVLPPEKISA